MKSKNLARLLGAIILAAVITMAFVPGCAKEAPAPAPAPAPEKEVITWKYQMHIRNSEPFGPYGPYMFHWPSYATWADEITALSDGRLKFEILEPGTIFPDSEGLAAVGGGAVDCAMTQPAWFGGTIPEIQVASGLPLAWDTQSEMWDAWYTYGLYDKIAPLYEEHNVKLFISPSIEYMNIHASFPVPGPEAVKGRKLRTWGAWGDYIEMLGGVALAIPYADCYMAMKLGTVEGVWTGVQSLETVKLKEVTTDLVTNKTGAIGGMFINIDSFEALPEDIQNLISRVTPHIIATGCFELLEHQSYIIGKAAAEYNIKLWHWSEEDWKKVRQQCAEELWPDLAAKSAMGPELMEIVKQQLRDHGKLD